MNQVYQNKKIRRSNTVYFISNAVISAADWFKQKPKNKKSKFELQGHHLLTSPKLQNVWLNVEPFGYGDVSQLLFMGTVM